jgi:hypothetical protein
MSLMFDPRAGTPTQTTSLEPPDSALNDAVRSPPGQEHASTVVSASP